MRREPQFAFHPLFDVSLFVVYLCYFSEGCEVVVSSLLHNTVHSLCVSILTYFYLRI